MSSDTLVQQGLDLMLYGMATVAVFVTVLVILTTLMSRILVRWFPESERSAPAAVRKDDGDVDPHLVAVIQTAIDRHRSRR